VTLTGSEPKAATEILGNSLGNDTPRGAAQSGAVSGDRVAELLASLTPEERARLVELAARAGQPRL